MNNYKDKECNFVAKMIHLGFNEMKSRGLEKIEMKGIFSGMIRSLQQKNFFYGTGDARRKAAGSYAWSLKAISMAKVNGHKIDADRSQLKVEHNIPVDYTLKTIWRDIDTLNVEDITNILFENSKTVVMTIEEDSSISLNKSMPEDWDGVDPYVRYRETEIEVVINPFSLEPR